MDQIRIAVIDDHHIFCDLLAKSLNLKDNIEVVLQCYNGKDLLEDLKHIDFDILILDLALQDIDCFTLIEKIREIKQDIRILVLSAETNPAIITSVLNMQVDGFFSKSEDYEEVYQAIDSVMKGEKYISKRIREFSAKNNGKNGVDINKLTSREKDIISLISGGYSSNEISEKLRISENTVDTHRKNIRKKLNMKSHSELIKFAVENKKYLLLSG